MPADKWDQYAAPAGDKWEQYAAPAAPPAPTSGPIGDKVPVPEGLQGRPTPYENNKVALSEGLVGVGKDLASTAQTIHNFNAPANGQAPMFPQPNFSKRILGMDTTASNPDQMAGKIASQGAQMLLGGIPAAEAALPSTARSGAALDALSGALSKTPVSLGRTTPALERAAQISDAGGGPMGAAQKLMYRSHGMTDINFPEARDYYSNISGQSAADKMGMSPTLKREIGNVREAFHGDLSDAAERGLPATEKNYLGQPMNGGKVNYENAIDEFHHAKQIQGFAKGAAKKALPAGGILGGLGYGYERLKGH